MTHDHFDHDAVDRVVGSPTVVRHPVAMEMQDLRLTGYADWHVPGHSSAGLANVIFVVESGPKGTPVRVCHLGDNRFPPPTEIVERIGRVDVLIVPADDSCHLLNYDEVNGFIDMFDPSVAIPAHYFIPGVTAIESTLEPPGGWLECRSNVRRIDGTASLNPDTLPGEPEIWLMTPGLD